MTNKIVTKNLLVLLGLLGAFQPHLAFSGSNHEPITYNSTVRTPRNHVMEQRSIEREAAFAATLANVLGGDTSGSTNSTIAKNQTPTASPKANPEGLHLRLNSHREGTLYTVWNDKAQVHGHEKSVDKNPVLVIDKPHKIKADRFVVIPKGSLKTAGKLTNTDISIYFRRDANNSTNQAAFHGFGGSAGRGLIMQYDVGRDGISNFSFAPGSETIDDPEILHYMRELANTFTHLGESTLKTFTPNGSQVFAPATAAK